jgi:hypothetical protein
MVGYAVSATCDLDGCNAKIDRGLAYVCGGMHNGGEHGCGNYFCYEHLYYGPPAQLCADCLERWDKEHACPDCGEELRQHFDSVWCPECDEEPAA